MKTNPGFLRFAGTLVIAFVCASNATGKPSESPHLLNARQLDVLRRGLIVPRDGVVVSTETAGAVALAHVGERGAQVVRVAQAPTGWDVELVIGNLKRQFQVHRDGSVDGVGPLTKNSAMAVGVVLLRAHHGAEVVDRYAPYGATPGVGNVWLVGRALDPWRKRELAPLVLIDGRNGAILGFDR